MARELKTHSSGLQYARELLSHNVKNNREGVQVLVLDDFGSGGACHHYAISFGSDPDDPTVVELMFQDGALQETGVNGITHEALLAVCIDRLQGFQSGDFMCEENRKALEHLEQGLEWLKTRTIRRIARGVEGTQRA